MRWLPDTAAYRTSSGPEGRRWTRLDDWLADLVEVMSIAASEKTRLRKPIEIDRPRYPEVTPEAASPAEVAVFFGLRYTPAGDQEETVR